MQGLRDCLSKAVVSCSFLSLTTPSGSSFPARCFKKLDSLPGLNRTDRAACNTRRELALGIWIRWIKNGGIRKQTDLHAARECGAY